MKVFFKVLLNVLLSLFLVGILIIISLAVFTIGFDYTGGLEFLCISALGFFLSVLLFYVFRKKKFLSVSLLVIGIVIFSAIGCRGYQQYSIYSIMMSHTLEWNEEEHTETIPFYFHHNGHIYLKTVINSEDKYFVFDTGADYTTINEKYNDSLALDTLNIKSSQARVVAMPVHKLDSLFFGAVNFKNLKYSAMKKDSWGNCGVFRGQDSVVGLLGNNVINNFVWDFDMVNRNVKITDVPYVDSLKKQKVVPLQRSGMGWKVNLKLNGKKKKIKLDSGSSSILNLTDSITLANTYAYPMTNTGKSLGIFSYLDCNGKEVKVDSSNLVLKRRSVFVNLSIAGATYKDAFVIDKSKSNLLGIPLFWEYERVVLDFLSKKMYLIHSVKNKNAYQISVKSISQLSRAKYNAISKLGFYELYYKKPIMIKTKSKLTHDTVIFSFKNKIKVFASLDSIVKEKKVNVVIDSVLGNGYSKNLKTEDSIYSSKLLWSLKENTVINKTEITKKL